MWCTRVKPKMEKSMEMECKNGLTVIGTKDTGPKTTPAAKEYFTMPTKTSTKELSSETKPMARVLSSKLTDQNTPVFGDKTFQTEKAYINLPTVQATKATTWQAKSTVLANSSGRTAATTKANGCIRCSRVRVLFAGVTEGSTKASGKITWCTETGAIRG